MSYRLAQGFVRGLGKQVFWFKWFLFGMALAYWVMGSFHYWLEEQNISFLGFIWYQLTGCARFYWFGSLVYFCFFLWSHYFLICLFIADHFYGKKREKIREMIRLFDKTNSREVLGVDLIQAENQLIREYDLDYDLQVLGEGQAARCLLQKFIHADLKEERSIIIIASSEEKDLLEELTYVFRGQRSGKMRPFFYFSLNHPERSASYSPFHKAQENFLADYFKLDWSSREAAILRQLLKALKTIGKPYELDDLILLLENKRAVMALNEIDLNREYLWHFDSNKKFRLALCEKLKHLGEDLKLEKYPITDGYPLGLEDILTRNKHLFIELDGKVSNLVSFFFSHLKYEINQKDCYQKPFIYLIHPEKFPYALETYLDDLPYEVWYRIFSNRFSPLYRSSQEWHTVFLSNTPSGERRKDEYKHFFEKMKSIQNEEAFKSTKTLVKEMRIKTAIGFFYQYRNGHHEMDFRWLYLSQKALGKTEYEPYQKRFKPEDMLRLRNQIARMKPALLRHDPGVIHIIQDLKPKEEANS